MRPLFIILTAAFMLSGSLPRALATDEPAAIAPSTLDEAREKAARENKNVLIVFSGAWDADCARLKQSTLVEGNVSTLLRERIVPLHIDVLTAPELTGKYHVRDVPLMVMIKPDGTEVDRWLGYQSANKFAEELASAIAGHPTLERLRAKVKPAEPQTRRELCELLINRGSYSDAMTELRRLYEQLEFSTTLNQMSDAWETYPSIIRILGSIRVVYPPAEDFLRTKRKAHVAEVTADPNDDDHADRIEDLDESLGQPAETLAFFRSLPKESRAYFALKHMAYSIMIDSRLYSEAVLLCSASEIARDIEKNSAKSNSPLIHGLIRTIYPIKGGEVIRQMYKGNTIYEASKFEPFAGVQDKPSARLIAEAVLKCDKSEEGAAILTAIAHRALDEQADAFLRSLDLPGLPAPAKQVASRPEAKQNWKSTPSEENSEVIRLEPYMVTTRTTGCIPLSVSLRIRFLKSEIKSHVPVHTPPTITTEALAPYRDGALLVALDGKSIKGKTWKWLGDFWVEGGEAGDQVTLILKGKGRDDCIYHEVKVKRVRPAALEKK